jgi:hypothetical protein
MKLTPEQKANKKRLADLDRRIKNRKPKHPRWGEILWVVGYVDSNGAVHAKIIFKDDDAHPFHDSVFPSALKYKTWRWTTGAGMEKSTLCAVNPDAEDEQAILNWLYKNGCLNDWEMTYME